MAELAALYLRYGYRRVRIFLGRDGHTMSVGRAHRLWQHAKLQVPRKRIATGRLRPKAAHGPNQVWSYDFVFDACGNGQQLKCFTITDECTKEGLAFEVDGRIRSGRVIEVLSRLVSERGAPVVLRSDNGPEFVSRALLKWIVEHGIEIALIDPGKPWQNGAAENFNGRFRDRPRSNVSKHFRIILARGGHDRAHPRALAAHRRSKHRLGEQLRARAVGSNAYR